jgi:hypothetical protein
MSYGYPAERFAAARQALVPPHTEGEHVSVVRAFHECRNGLHRMNRSTLHEDVRIWIYRLECFMDTDGFADAGGESAWTIKARGLSADERLKLAQLVDDLAQWFASHAN